MRNASQRKDIRLAEKHAELAEKNRIEFIVAAMSTIQGRAWFYDLLATCSIFSAEYFEDARLDARIQGQRNVGLSIYNDIVRNCPQYFVTMMEEAVIKEQVNERRESDAADDGSSFGEFAGSEDRDG